MDLSQLRPLLVVPDVATHPSTVLTTAFYDGNDDDDLEFNWR